MIIQVKNDPKTEALLHARHGPIIAGLLLGRVLNTRVRHPITRKPACKRGAYIVLLNRIYRLPRSSFTVIDRDFNAFNLMEKRRAGILLTPWRSPFDQFAELIQAQTIHPVYDLDDGDPVPPPPPPYRGPCWDPPPEFLFIPKGIYNPPKTNRHWKEAPWFRRWKIRQRKKEKKKKKKAPNAKIPTYKMIQNLRRRKRFPITRPQLVRYVMKHTKCNHRRTAYRLIYQLAAKGWLKYEPQTNTFDAPLLAPFGQEVKEEGANPTEPPALPFFPFPTIDKPPPQSEV